MKDGANPKDLRPTNSRRVPAQPSGPAHKVLVVLSTLISVSFIGFLLPSNPLFYIALVSVLFLLVISSKGPLRLVMLIIMTNIDLLQESLKLSGLTLFQILSSILFITGVLQYLSGLKSRRSLQVSLFAKSSRSTTFSMRFMLLMLLFTLSIFPLLLFKGMMTFVAIGNILRLQILIVIMLFGDSENMERVVTSITLLGTLISLSIVTTYFSETGSFLSGRVLFTHGRYLRVLGLARDPNYAALRLLMTLPFVIYRLYMVQSRKALFLHILMAMVIMVALLLTGSRAGLITTIFLVGLWLGIPWRREGVHSRLGAKVLVVCALIALALVARPLWQGIAERLLLPGESVTAIYDKEYDSRWYRVSDGLQVWGRSPIFGVGAREVGYHNSYVDVLAQFGVLGAGSLGLLLVYLGSGLWHVVRYEINGNVMALALTVLLSIVSWGLMSITIGATRELLLWVVLGMGTRLVQRRGSKAIAVVRGRVGPHVVRKRKFSVRKDC